MAGFSDFLEDELLDHVFRNAAYTQPATVYAALFTAAPSDAGGGTECAGTDYAREAVTFGAASSGAIANSAEVDFGSTGAADWGELTHFGIYDASTAGNLLAWAALTASKTPGSGDPVKFPVGDLDVTLD